MLRRIAAIVVVVALIFTGVHFFMYNSSDESIGEIGLYYDDYIEAPGAESATGSVKIETINEETFIHATKIGNGSVTFEDGSVKTYSVKKAPLDVFLLIGQSNAAYKTYYDPETSTKTTPGTAYFYGVDKPVYALDYNSTVKEECGIRSMNDSDGTQLIGNIEAPLASALYDSMNTKVLIINGAVSGVKVNTYAPDNINFLRASDIFNDAMASIDTDLFVPTVKSYIWIQGESDAETPVEDYEMLYLEMHSDLTGKGNDLFSSYSFDTGFISLIVGKNSSVAQIMITYNSANNVILGAVSAPTFSVEDGTLGVDNTHYTQLGDNIIGAELAESITEYYKGVNL